LQTADLCNHYSFIITERLVIDT